MLKGFETAGEQGFTGGAKELDMIDVDGGRGGDALVEKVVAAAPDVGVLIDLGRKQTDEGAETVTALKWLGWGGADARLEVGRRPADGEADGALERGLGVGVVRNDLEGGDAEIKGLGWVWGWG